MEYKSLIVSFLAATPGTNQTTPPTRTREVTEEKKKAHIASIWRKKEGSTGERGESRGVLQGGSQRIKS